MQEHSSNQMVFYATPSSPCSYLDNQVSKSVFLDPKYPLTNKSHNQLNRLGFRRSGNHIYKPWCENCNACKSVRITMEGFKLSKNQRRVLQRNQDLQVVWQTIGSNDTYLDLYTRYINQRHHDSDMYPPSKEQFERFLGTKSASINGHFLCFYLEQALVAVSVVDILDDGISAIYTFYDPELSHRSLGKVAILWLARWLQKHHLPYLYLGFWVKDSPKMDYKINYQPLEYFNGTSWLPLSKDMAKDI